MSDDGVKYATDEVCIECGEQAVCFWPACDPDIQSFPFCRPCVDTAKLKLMLRLSEMREHSSR